MIRFAPHQRMPGGGVQMPPTVESAERSIDPVIAHDPPER